MQAIHLTFNTSDAANTFRKGLLRLNQTVSTPWFNEITGRWAITRLVTQRVAEAHYANNT